MKRGTKPLNPIGRRSRKHLTLNVELKRQAQAEGWFDHCEMKSLSLEWPFWPCYGRLTFAHSLKTEARLQLSGAERERTDREVARVCERHHYFVLDLLSPALTAKLVRLAIARRETEV